MFLDCAPSMSLVSESIFGAADVLLVPTIPTTLSVRTLEQLGEFLGGKGGSGGNGGKKVDRLPSPRVLTFFSLADRRKRLHRDVMAGARRATGRARGGGSVRHRGRADGKAPRAGRRVRAVESRGAQL